MPESRCRPSWHSSGPRLCGDEPSLRPFLRHPRCAREYERASPTWPKSRLGQTAHRTYSASPSPATVTGADAPAIKARLRGWLLLRAPAQGSCPYANICEHCPNFRTDAASVSILSLSGWTPKRWRPTLSPRRVVIDRGRAATGASSTRLDALLAEGEKCGWDDTPCDSGQDSSRRALISSKTVSP